MKQKMHSLLLSFCLLAVTLFVFLVAVSAGSVPVPPGETFALIVEGLFGVHALDTDYRAIILAVRLPRVLSAALVGAALALAGAAMQGLLRNPLADGSTLGVSAGASLGAVVSIAVGFALPGLPIFGVAATAILFSFFSLLLILGIAFRLDKSLSTNTIILTGIVFSMFANSLISLIITFSDRHIKSILFWTMGSLSGSSYSQALLLFLTLLLFGIPILLRTEELDAFSIGEDNAAHLGVDVRRVKLLLLICASGLIGVSVSVSGNIAFVGLVIPHMTRMLTGPRHRHVLPASLFTGAVFLMLADLAARFVLSPLVLPIGIVTSLVGAVVFLSILCRTRRKDQ